jgi:uncharacterized protein
MATRKRRAPYRRPVYEAILARAHEPRRFLQVLAGPRQVGKTTLARQVMDAVGVPAHFASADDPTLRDAGWLAVQWQIGRARARDGGRAGGLLVLDEIQKVPDWSEWVKRFWDEDSASTVPLRVMLLGSAPLLVQRGVTESLAGRFELIRVTHWSFAEMRDAFGWDLDRYLYFGGYPGAADLIGDEERWARYVLDALVETSLSRDVLLLSRVDKPALLRRLFQLGCQRSGEVVSYTQMLDELPGVGNTTTLAHYLELLAGSGMLTGLPKYTGGELRQRASSPKLLALNSALIAATGSSPFDSVQTDGALRARLAVSAVGAHLAAELPTGGSLHYWREGQRGVDYVVVPGRARDAAVERPVAIELRLSVGSGGGGLAAFASLYPGARQLIVGDGGVPLETFLAEPLDAWLQPSGQ